MVSATNGSTNLSFTYDDTGLVSTRTKNGATTKYYYNGTQLIAEVTPTYILGYLYEADGSPLGMTYRDTTTSDSEVECYWFEKNLFGDIVAIYSETGTRLATYRYSSAWGYSYISYENGGANTHAGLNPFRYRGYYYDSDLGLYRTQTRYYSPTWGRFISPDNQLNTDSILGYNLYIYCENNPVMYVDYSGKEPISLILAIGLKAIATVVLAVGLSWLVYDITHDQILGNTIADAVSEVVEASKSITDSKEETVVAPPNKQAYFTVNPYDFNPARLVRTEYAGSKNGRIIKWTDPNTNIPIFEWNEDLKYGSHYHIPINGKHSGDHILPNSPVPEPWNSIYFGG